MELVCFRCAGRISAHATTNLCVGHIKDILMVVYESPTWPI